MIEVRMQSRTVEIEKLIDAHIRRDISWDDLCDRIESMGYKTVGLFDMVRAREHELNKIAPGRRDALHGDG
jgi:hypothetical protein